MITAVLIVLYCFNLTKVKMKRATTSEEEREEEGKKTPTKLHNRELYLLTTSHTPCQMTLSTQLALVGRSKKGEKDEARMDKRR